MKRYQRFGTIMMLSAMSIAFMGCGKTSQKPVESSYISSVIESSSTFSEPISSSSESSEFSSELPSSSSLSSSLKNEAPGVGDVIKTWSSIDDMYSIPLDTPNTYDDGRGSRHIFRVFGREDNYSLSYDLYCGRDNKGYISTSAASSQFFKSSDVKNGYIVSLYYYVIKGGNIKSFQLQGVSENYADEIYGETIDVGSEDEECWKRITMSFDTVDAFKSFRLIYTVIDPSKVGSFLIDDISVTIGSPVATEKRKPKVESLAKKYEGDFRIGTCLSSYSLGNKTLKNITIENFNSITAENEGKPEHILDQEGCQKLLKVNPAGVAVKTSGLASIYDFAEANHMKVRHHTLVWHNQTPDWFFMDDYKSTGKLVSKDLMLKRLENFISVTLDAINSRWPGLVYAIDVANEAIDYGTVRKNKNKWYDTIGSEYVYYAMKYAHRYKASYQDLYYNDYSYDFVSNNCSYALNTLLKKAIEEKLVDGLGIQGHLISSSNMDTIIKDAKMIYQKGLKCQITELDIGINDDTETSIDKQTAAYRSLFTKIVQANKNEEANINAVVLWGVSDNYSWRNDEYPLLFDSNFNKKPSYYAFYNAKGND